jgi:ABC-2 type transport system ATP-binding protein
MLKSGRIVALDSTENLLATFSGLTLKLGLGGGELPEALLPRVASREGARVALRLDDYTELEQVLGGLRQAGLAITEFELQPPDLEEVFLRVMARHS